MKLSQFLKSCESDEQVDLTHFMILDRERTLCKYCKPPYDIESPRLFFSMTKSVASLAIGLAVEKGLLSFTDLVCRFFPDQIPECPSENLLKLNVRHLLTMSVGINFNTYPELVVTKNWVKAFLAQDFPNEPGTNYLYCTHASHMLSALITAVSGLSLETFLNENLFWKMGITDAQWETSPEGLTAGGMGLSLTPASTAKLARLLLNDGVYQGRLLLPKSYLHAATSPQIKKQADDGQLKGNYYGYQFHIARDGSYYLDGAFGQMILVCPQRNLAFIVFSRNSKTERLLVHIDRHFIQDSFEPEPDLLFSPHIKIFAPQTFQNSVFLLENNPLELVSIEFLQDKILFEHKNGSKNPIQFDFNGIFKGRAWFLKDLQWHEQGYVSEVVCAEQDRLAVKIFWIETPYVTTCEFHFENKELLFRFDINVSFTLSAFEVKGRLDRSKPCLEEFA